MTVVVIVLWVTTVVVVMLIVERILIQIQVLDIAVVVGLEDFEDEWPKWIFLVNYGSKLL